MVGFFQRRWQRLRNNLLGQIRVIVREELAAAGAQSTAGSPRNEGKLVERLRGVMRENVSVYAGRGRTLAWVGEWKMYLPVADTDIAPHLMLGKTWEANTTRVFKNLIEPGMTVVDVGANVGYFTLLAVRAAGEGGRVIAFEPDPDNFWCLRKNRKINGLDGWNVEVVPQALWKTDGETLTLRRATDSGGGHTLLDISDRIETDTPDTVEVQTVTLDAFLGDNLKVDVIKMDAEGAEPAIFEGMSRTLAANPKLKIILEFSPEHVRAAGYDPRSYLAGLVDHGFALSLIEAEGEPQSLDLDGLVALFPTVDWPENLLLIRE